MTEPEIIEIEHHYLNHKGTQLHFVTCGRVGNPPLFLLHSFYTSWGIFKPLFRNLAKRFYLVAPDLPGFGDSQVLDGVNNNQSFAQVLEAIRTKLELGKVAVFGFSAGGILALKYASLYPTAVVRVVEQGAPYYFRDYDIILRDKILLRLSRLTIIPRLIQYLARSPWVWELVRRFSKNLDAELKVMEKGRLERDFTRIKFRAAYGWAKDILRVDLRSDLPKIKCPVKVVAGDKDPYLKLDGIYRMKNLIKDCELDIITGGDHELTLKNTEMISLKIIGFCPN
jgi:pimeloyl-ACP methyl ester carboxylesterase